MRQLFVFLLAWTIMSVSCQGQPVSKHSRLNGNWFMEFNSNDIGRVRTFMQFEFGDSTFSAHTRPGVDREILGFWKSTLGRWFTNDFKHGALINVTDGKLKQRGDTLLLSAIFRSALGSYYFKGKLLHTSLEVTLLNGKKELRGTLSGSRQLPAAPLCNYPALVNKALQATRENIFNPSVFATGQWKTFEKDIKQVSASMQDDLEMEFAFFYYGSKLPFSHYALMRKMPESADTSNHAPDEQLVFLEEKQPGTVYMKIASFGGPAAEMDSAFAQIARKRYKTLIVDLRSNPGGAIASGMSFGRHLADTTFYGGVFLTQKWFEKHSAPPAVKDYTALPVFTEANYDLLIEGIHLQQGLCLKVVPAEQTFKGKVYILTSNVTASTCEPIVYGLKQRKRAVLVGEQTAGAMLNGEPFTLADGFSVFLPTADYYAADGYRIDKKGIAPDIKVEPAKALDHVLQLIK